MSTVETNVPAVGDVAEPKTFGPLTRTDFVRYQGASGDFNPLHHDEGSAKAAGFSTVFSVGMFQAGLLATYATDWLGQETIRRFTARFQAQCWPGDELTCTGEVTAVEDQGASSRVTVELTCTRQAGDTAISATAEFELPTAS